MFRLSLLKTFVSEISSRNWVFLPEDCTIRLSRIQRNANVSVGLLYGNKWVDPTGGTIDFFNDMQFL